MGQKEMTGLSGKITASLGALKTSSLYISKDAPKASPQAFAGG